MKYYKLTYHNVIYILINKVIKVYIKNQPFDIEPIRLLRPLFNKD